MRDKIKDALTHLISAIQAAKIYTSEHPKFIDFIDRAHQSLQEILRERSELVIGIINGELAFEHEIFFELSQRLRPLILYLEENEIERIAFSPGLQKEELAKFITFLTSAAKQERKEFEGLFSLLGIRNIMAGKIKAPTPELEKRVKEIKRYLSDYEGSLEKVKHYMETVIDQEEIDYLELRFDVLNFLENLIETYQEFLDLTTFKRKDLVTFVHLLNVTILSMYISSRIGFVKDDVLEIGIAALFHDIGKLYISKKIVQKTDKLNAEELALMKHHTVIGAEILFKYIDTLGILPIVVAFEHHLRYDLKGYPKLSFPQPLHQASLIVSLCDVYDALAQRRSYKKSLPPQKIYEVMMNEKGKLFEPELLEKFFRTMGVWPVKTIVALSDGSVAVVREQNESDIFKPKVEVVSPKKKKRVVDLLKSKITIQDYLDPSGKGQKYLHLIGTPA